jgi:hypothetical protein
VGGDVPLGLGLELGVQRVGRPAFLQGAPDHLGLGLGGQAADGLVAVEVGGELRQLIESVYDTLEGSSTWNCTAPAASPA